MNITSGIVQTALKVVVYGAEGIGKSTFASRFPAPLFIDTEGSTRHMNVIRFDAPTSWQMLLQQVDYVLHNDVCQTLVIDTADWAEMLCSKFICDRANVTSIEDWGYGKGYTYLQEEFGRLLNKLEDVVRRNIHVVITAHAKMRKFEQPDEMGAYDRWEMKLSKGVAPMVKEWADMVLFANYETNVVNVGTEKSKNYKASGGRRVMYTNHHPCWDAKNRQGLPDKLPFDYGEIEKVVETVTPNYSTPVQTTAEPSTIEQAPTFDFVDEEPAQMSMVPPEGLPKALTDLMEANHVTEEEIRMAVSHKGYFPLDTPIVNYGEDFINGCLIAAWDQVFAIVQNIRETPF